ncbi:PH domain-containing protein [Sporosarcina pasteurii]|uniref:Bacterial membrane flanked domain n=1 Tax=Sporosarcina pasteurii TaxID=1474 RepID=A0A380CGS0_SPOPA|nr:PH domain-containing protein [Sporosarcina pasteurii]MDS9472174.1 PH domain-containing protein [Sporosarcina pasteurii]QBQ06885.1 hypothetical protein E2C16_15105 [Sporosarcina pasteurii]SUJ20239.1 Bacterial membrane flanked domain [Sporosarcina pasteurii]
MRRQPINRISEKGLRVWRLYGIIQTFFVLLVAIGAGVLAYIFEWSWYIYGIAGIIVIAYAYLFVYLFPKIKWLRWRYEVRESEIELQHGLFIVKRTLIPMVRVQHVDTSQGPILRKYNLAGITISTAATNHEIPALIVEEADELRSRISTLARVADDDV